MVIIRSKFRLNRRRNHTHMSSPHMGMRVTYVSMFLVKGSEMAVLFTGKLGGR